MTDQSELIKVEQAESRTTRAPRELIWNAWIDIATWPRWMSSVLEAGPPQVLKEKSQGWIRTAGGKQRIVVTHITHLRKLDIEYSVPLARLVITRTLSQKVGVETVFIHEWQYRGLLGPIYRRVMRKTMERTLSETCDGLKRYVEELADREA